VRLNSNENDIQAKIDAIWRDMERGLISPAVTELRIARIEAEAGWRQAGSISYRAD